MRLRSLVVNGKSSLIILLILIGFKFTFQLGSDKIKNAKNEEDLFAVQGKKGRKMTCAKEKENHPFPDNPTTFSL